jgi:hypothetical protein
MAQKFQPAAGFQRDMLNFTVILGNEQMLALLRHRNIPHTGIRQ